MKLKWFVLMAIAAVWGGAMVGAFVAIDADVVFAGDTCPSGGNWHKIDSSDLSLYPVAGADDYCFKAGQWISGSIPEGGFGQDGSCNDGIQFCELSHWSYHIPDPPTPTPVTPTPTPEDPTPTPEEPTPTPEEPTPTPENPTPTPENPTPTPTNPPKREPTPTELPKTGVSPLSTNYNAVWQEDGLPDNMYLAHNGMAAGPNVGLEWVMLRANNIYSSVYLGNVDYWITGRLIVEAEDTWVLDLIRQYDGIVLMTCSEFHPEEGDPTQGYWAKRVLIFAQAVGE